ncbi:MAG: hypothetical protein ACTSW1_09075 [Candidatus Hodarchaeales archaeon]
MSSKRSVKNWRITAKSDTLDDEQASRYLTSHFTVDSRDPPSITVTCIEDGYRYLYSYPEPKLISKDPWT